MISSGSAPIEGGLLYAEDLAARVGLLISLGPAIMTESQIRAFAQRWDPLPIHVGDGGPFGGVIASGLHTFAVFQRLAVDAAYFSWAVVAARAIREMVLPRPVFPGDVLTGWVRVNGASPPRNGMAKLEVEGHLENQHGKTALSVRLDVYVSTRTRPLSR
ncbi:MAG: MaoC/PaaZ C-terminal domain-containing protein [Parvibaculum sedimenti]|uniref:MaoC/PaaZ C-terminal domain-containing protein n=1 Tax=Parvibaculum sedimenti TaxID=2608632 RepID=UPI003BB589C2